MPSKQVLQRGRSVHKNSWKVAQSKARIKRRSKIALGILAIIIGLLILSWVIRFTHSLFTPWKLSEKHPRNYMWNGELNINLLVRTSTISLFSYNPKEEKIEIVDIPDETFLEVPAGFGSWQLRSVYGLGQTQKDLGGDKLLIDTLTSFFALPIDGYLDLSSLPGQKTPTEVIEELRQSPISGLKFLSVLKTDLTPLELLRLKFSLSSVRFDKVYKTDLLKLNVLDKESLPDGTEVYRTDPVKLDSALSDLVDPAIVLEHKTIAVFNATDQPQLAGKWARLITNLGGNVIITSNAKARLSKTQVLGEQSLTLRRLQQVFGNLDCQNNPKCDKISTLKEDLNSSRAQINVFVGEDFVNR